MDKRSKGNHNQIDGQRSVSHWKPKGQTNTAETSGTQNDWYPNWNRWVTWTREQSIHNADNSTKTRKQSVYDLRSSAREKSS